MIKLKFIIILAITFLIARHLTSTSYSILLYAVVTLPGTFLHELAHYSTALVLGGHPSNFSIIPSGNTLGSVQFYSNWYNAATVGLSPLLLAPLTFLLAAKATVADSPLKTLMFSYFAACSWVACTPSAPDFSIAMTISSWPLAFVFLSMATILTYVSCKRILTRSF